MLYRSWLVAGVATMVAVATQFNYPYPDDVAARLTALHERAPSVTTPLDVIGKSVEQRPLWLWCVGIPCRRPGQQPSAPASAPTYGLLLTALHHAREPLGLLVGMAFVESAVSGWERGDPEWVTTLSHTAIYLMPIVNPDAYVYNLQHRATGQVMMRKNRRPPPGVACSAYDGGGVDLNRNYDFSWQYDDKGSNPYPCAEDYRGAAPFSEPETAAVRDALLALPHGSITVALNYHSYGRYINVPYAVQHLGSVPAPHDAIYEGLASGLTAVTGYSHGHPWDGGLYTVNGEASDYMFHRHGIYALSPELGPRMEAEFTEGMWPAAESVPSLLAEGQALTQAALVAAAPRLMLSGTPFASNGPHRTVFIHNAGVVATSRLVLSLLAADAQWTSPMLCGVPGAVHDGGNLRATSTACSISVSALFQPNENSGTVPQLGCPLPARSYRHLASTHSVATGHARVVASTTPTMHAVVQGEVAPFSVANATWTVPPTLSDACTPGRVAGAGTPFGYMFMSAAHNCQAFALTCGANGEWLPLPLMLAVPACFPCNWLRWDAGVRQVGQPWWGDADDVPAPSHAAGPGTTLHVDLGGWMAPPHQMSLSLQVAIIVVTTLLTGVALVTVRGRIARHWAAAAATSVAATSVADEASSPTSMAAGSGFHAAAPHSGGTATSRDAVTSQRPLAASP